MSTSRDRSLVTIQSQAIDENGYLQEEPHLLKSGSTLPSHDEEYAPPKTWAPRRIESEFEFSRFVSSFRDGMPVRVLLPDQAAMGLNADYFFPQDNVIVELKCMEVDTLDPESYARRLTKSYRHFGYSGSDLLAYLLQGAPMPENVAKHLLQAIANPIRQAMRKANRQIAATKRSLRRPDASGLVVFANNQNYGVTPAQALTILSRAALGLSDSHVDGFIYTTPNVYHDTAGDGIARSIWAPLYAAGKERLADFVNPFGAGWGDHLDSLGDPFLERTVADGLDSNVMNASPITQFQGKKRRP